MKKYMVAFLALALLLPGVSGCASKYGEQKTAVNYYPACYRPIQDLRAREHDVAKGTAGGAAIGALGGALLGFLASGGKWQGAVVGAAAGGATGSMVGHMQATQRQAAEDNRRLAQYLSDIDGDISNLDIVGAAATNSLQCYDRQFDQLVAAIKSRAITREAAQQRFAEISSGREEAIAILGDAISHGRNLQQQYEQAFASEQQQLQTPQAMAQGQQAYRRKANTLNTARKRQQTLASKTSSLETERSQAQSTSSAQIREIQEALANQRA